jgi:DHA1 family inner membrane transport protein
MPTVIATLSTLAIALFAMTFAIESKLATVAMMLLFGTAAFAVVAPL